MGYKVKKNALKPNAVPSQNLRPQEVLNNENDTDECGVKPTNIFN